ncbi:MAG: HU family DNA-binding protein [Nitrospinales bacterium]
MIRAELAAKLANEMMISKQEADRYLLTMINAITTGLNNDGKVVIQGFGSFKVKEYVARMGKKPVTGEPISIPARKKPVFHASKELNRIINNEPRHGVRSRSEANPEVTTEFSVPA